MANPYFQFKQFTVFHDRCAMKVTTDACLFGAWCAGAIRRQPGQAGQILDMGTGSGLLALMIAQQNEAQIDALEIDIAAAAQAAENIARSPWAERVNVIHADIREAGLHKTYDCIVSNPPFYERDLVALEAARNRAHHSTELTLEQLLEQTRMRLKPEGRFFLLMPYKRAAETERRLQAAGLHLLEKTVVRPSPRHAPSRLMLMGTAQGPVATVSTELSIRDEGQAYTPAFTELLCGYYLYL